jgi:RecB family endonuclease NucS
MSPVSDGQRSEIVKMLRDGLAVEEISRRLGVPRGSIIAVKAHVKMGTYEDEPAEKVLEEAVETTFGLERDLQRALRSNIEQLEHGLKIKDGGKEQTVESGRIDIIAEDRSGTIVVIELKAGAADREAVGQILSYMGDLSQTKKVVRGILVAGDFHSRSISAARAVPNLKLKKYNFKFSFEEVGGA